MKYIPLNFGGVSSGWLALAAVAVLSLTSCDKVSDLVGKAKGLVSDAEQTGSTSNATVEVESVDEKAGKSVIAEESRMVMVEFYSDT